ncbi:MAG: enoyl-CoA hydratase-related protein [Pseudomonadota bacterium]
MHTEEFSDIHYELDDEGIVTVHLNTLWRKNAISGLTALELYYAAKHFQSDDAALAMIITGATDPDSGANKQAFSSGGYFVPSVYEGVPEKIMAQIDLTDIAMKRTVLEFFSCDKPVLAAINGLAIGGGLTLPLAVADQIYASEYAWARLPFASLGISAELGSTYMLPRLLGMHKAKELFFYPDRIEAQQLSELGLVNAVVPHDELLSYARDKALQLIPPRGAGASIRAMKRIMHQQRVAELTQALDLENEALNELIKSEDFIEGFTARVEKRDAVFKGR